MKSYIKTVRKEFWKFFLKIRSKFVPDNGRSISNLYLLTMQKSGSQWIKQVLNDRYILKKSGLKLYPQHRYEWTEFHHKFPKGTFVPGLYMSYDLYEEIEKPSQYKTICVVRDPRDIVVSWYFSMLKTHGLMGKVYKYRKALKKITIDEGLHYCIDELALKFSAMRTWFNNTNDPNMLIVKFEDLVQYPTTTFSKVFEFCNIEITKGELESVLSRYTKEKMRENDLKRRTDKSDSHYRVKRSKHSDYFTEEHYNHFYKVTGNLTDVMGYE